MSRYLYILRSNVCKCSHENAKHKVRCTVDGCECTELRFEQYEIEADTIREAAEKLNKKLDDLVYTHKTKL